MDTPFSFIHVGTPQYIRAYDAFVPASTEPTTLIPHLRQVARRQRRVGNTAADWAAGGGRNSSLLLDEGFTTVHAVELVGDACAEIRRNVPRAQVVQSAVLDFKPPAPVALGLMIHLVYPSHVGSQNVERYIRHGMEALAIGGTLVVVTMSWGTATNQALEYFGAPRVNLAGHVTPLINASPAFEFTFTTLPAEVTFADLETTTLVARWMLSDQPPEAYSVALAQERLTESSFLRYVRTHLWNGSRGHWHSPPLVIEITRRR